MQGLLAQKMKPQQSSGQRGPGPAQGPAPAKQGRSGQPAQGQPAQGQQASGNESVDVVPEKAQEQVTAATNSMLKALYGDSFDSVKKMLQTNNQDPEVAVGRVVGRLMTTTYQALADNGKTIAPGIMVRSGMTAAKAVGELAERMGMVSGEQVKDVVEGGFMVGMAEFGQASKGAMNKAQRSRYADLLKAMSEAKQQAEGGQEGGPGGMPGGPGGKPRQKPQQPGRGGPAGGMMQ